MKITKQIKIRDVLVGGGAPIAVQSMTNTDTRDAQATLAQIRALADAGCDIVRCAVPDMQAAEALREICANSPLPVVADIHFDYRLALAAIESGVDKIRLNPGNIGGADRVQAVVKAAKARHLPIRIGVNSGSVEKHILEKFGGPTPEAMVESALYHVGLLNDCDFDDICISIKSSSVPNTMQAYLLASEKTDYPLHLGVTEAGTEYMGTIKSAAGIGGLLALGVLLLRDGPLCIRKPGSWRITSACLRNLWRVGTPLAAERAALSSAQVLLVRIVSGLGTVAIAANSLGVSAEGLCYMAGYGIQDASIALIGQAVGAHRRDMAKRFAWLCTMMGIGIMALSGVGLWLFAPALMGIFTADAAVIALGAQVLRIEAFAEPMFGASIVASGAMQGAGDSTGCFLLNLFSMWGVRLTLAFLLAPRLGLVGVWAARCIELCIRGALFLIRLARGKWLDKGALQ